MFMVLNPNSVETHTLSDWSLGQTLRLLSAGSFSLPSFQRAFVWDEDLISELIRSVFLGYHIGNLLLWQPDDGLLKKMSPEPLYGINEQRPHQHGDRTNRTGGEIIVLDGQQRLTALHYAFSAPSLEIPDTRRPLYSGLPVRFFLRVNEFMRYLHGASNSADQLTAPDLVHYEPAQEDPSGDPSPEKHLLPLSLLEAEAAPSLRAWLINYESFWSERHKELKRVAGDLARVADDLARVAGDLASQVDEQRTRDAEDAWAAKETELDGVARELEAVAQHDEDAKGLEAALRSVLEQYKVQFILLRRDESPDRVKDTFMQVNRRGKQLNNFELFSAEASWMGMNPTHLVEEAANRLRENDRLGISRERLQYFIPQLMLLRRRPDLTSDDISMQKFETYFGRFFLPGAGNDSAFTSVDDFKNAWWAAFEDLRSGLLALRDHEMFGAVEKDNYHCFALYDGLVPAFAAIWSDAHRTEIAIPEPLRDKKIHQWYWSRVFSDEPYLNAPSDLEWSERESNAVMMINDHREVMAWLERSDDRRQYWPKVVRQTAYRMSASQTRRAAHRHDGRMPSGGRMPSDGNSQDRAATAVYYSVLNFMNTIGPKHLVWGSPYQPVQASAILTQAWADRTSDIAPTEIASPFNQLLTDDYTHELIQLGVTPALYFREIEFDWTHRRRTSRHYVEMLNSHCISVKMYNVLATKGQKVSSIQGSIRISDRRNEQDLEWKLERWRQGQRRTQTEQKEIESSASFSAQDYRQFIASREELFLHEFGKRVLDVDLNIGLEDRELGLDRGPQIEGSLRRAIGRLLVGLPSDVFEERVSGAQGIGGKLGYYEQRAKKLAESACNKCKTEEQAEAELAQGNWALSHSQWFASVFYNELAQQEGWPKGAPESKTFMADLESLREYRNYFAHDKDPRDIKDSTRNLGRDAIDALEQHWGLGG